MGGMFGAGVMKQERQPPVWVVFFFFQFYFIYFVLAVLGLDCCPGDPLLEESRGYSLAVVWFLLVVASLVAECGF